MDFFDTLMMKSLPPSPPPQSTLMPVAKTCQDDLDLEHSGILIGSIGSVEECISNANIHIHPVCGNCCFQFNDTGGGVIYTGSLDPLYQHLGENRIYEISMSRSPQENSSMYQCQYQNDNESLNLKVWDILSSIYKLNYLNSVESHVIGTETDNNNVPLCSRCADALISLYRAHENMNQLRSLDSYISQKLSELDSFITSLISNVHSSANISNVHHIPFNSTLVTEEQFEREIDPGSIKIEVNYGNDDFYSELSQSPIEIKSEEPRTRSSSSAAQMLGPPWVCVERLRPSEINSVISQASSSVPISRCPVPKSYKGQRQLRSSAVHNIKPAQKNEASDFDSNYHPPEKIGKGNSKKKLKLKTVVASIKKRGKKSPLKIPVKTHPRKSKSKKTKPTRSTSRAATSSKKRKISPIDNNSDGLESQGEGDEVGITIVKTQSMDSDIFKKQTEKAANSKSESAFVNKCIQNVQVPKRIKGKTGMYIDHFVRRKTVPCPCLYCPVDFQSPVERADHLRLIHVKEAFIEKSIICEPCGKIFDKSNRSSFKGHLPKCNQIPYGIQLPPFICSYCNKEFSLKRSRDSHEKDVHAAERSFPCTHDQCSYKATSAQRLQKHVRNMHVDREGTFCDICKRTYSSEETFKSHHNRVHTEEGRKLYEKRDAITTAKRKEMRRKNAITNFVCCNVDFLSRTRLMRHKVTEHGINLNLEYICEQCGRGFVSSYNLKKHILFTHTEERPFICEQCGRSFKMIQNLKFHIKTTHSEEGRLKYNKLMRENNRKRQAIKKQVALASTGPSVGIGSNSSPNKSRSNNLFQPQEPLPPPPEVMTDMQF